MSIAAASPTTSDSGIPYSTSNEDSQDDEDYLDDSGHIALWEGFDGESPVWPNDESAVWQAHRGVMEPRFEWLPGICCSDPPNHSNCRLFSIHVSP